MGVLGEHWTETWAAGIQSHLQRLHKQGRYAHAEAQQYEHDRIQTELRFNEKRKRLLEAMKLGIEGGCLNVGCESQMADKLLKFELALESSLEVATYVAGGLTVNRNIIKEYWNNSFRGMVNHCGCKDLVTKRGGLLARLVVQVSCQSSKSACASFGSRKLTNREFGNDMAIQRYEGLEFFVNRKAIELLYEYDLVNEFNQIMEDIGSLYRVGVDLGEWNDSLIADDGLSIQDLQIMMRTTPGYKNDKVTSIRRGGTDWRKEKARKIGTNLR